MQSLARLTEYHPDTVRFFYQFPWYIRLQCKIIWPLFPLWLMTARQVISDSIYSRYAGDISQWNHFVKVDADLDTHPEQLHKPSTLVHPSDRRKPDRGTEVLTRRNPRSQHPRRVLAVGKSRLTGPIHSHSACAARANLPRISMEIHKLSLKCCLKFYGFHFGAFQRKMLPFSNSVAS